MNLKGFLTKFRTLFQNARLFGARLAGRKTVVFYCDVGFRFAYMESLWHVLTARNDLRCWVAVHSLKQAETVAFLVSRGVSLREILIVETPHSLKCVDVFFRTTGDTTPDCRCECVQLFHGLSGWGCAKSGGADPTMDSLTPYNHLFLTGPNQESIIRERYFALHPDAKEYTTLHQIGSPKTDALFDGSYSRESVVVEYGLSAERPIVLYAPTWEADASLNLYGDEILGALASLDVSLLIKPHPHFLGKDWPRSDGLHWAEYLEAFATKNANCRLISDVNSNPYLVAADVMVTDVSGIGFEYILLNKPIIFYDCPMFFAQRNGDGVEFWGRSSGEVVGAPHELVLAVERAINEPQRLDTESGELIKKLVYQRGCATNAAVRAFEEIVIRH